MNLQYDQMKLNKVCEDHGVSYLALFGSYARGDASAASDIDFLIKYSPNSNVVSLFDHVGVQMKFEVLFRKPVDLVEAHTLKPKIRPYVEKDLRILYER